MCRDTSNASAVLSSFLMQRKPDFTGNLTVFDRFKHKYLCIHKQSKV